MSPERLPYPYLSANDWSDRETRFTLAIGLRRDNRCQFLFHWGTIGISSYFTEQISENTLAPIVAPQSFE